MAENTVQPALFLSVLICTVSREKDDAEKFFLWVLVKSPSTHVLLQQSSRFFHSVPPILWCPGLCGLRVIVNSSCHISIYKYMAVCNVSVGEISHEHIL